MILIAHKTFNNMIVAFTKFVKNFILHSVHEHAKVSLKDQEN